jgi:hypothetical protein
VNRGRQLEETDGDDDPSFAYTLSGFKFGQTEAGLRAATPAALTGAASCTAPPANSVGGSPYTLTCTPGTLPRQLQLRDGTLANFTINKATLNVNAVANSKTYGDDDPSFAYTLSGFKFGQTEAACGRRRRRP